MENIDLLLTAANVCRNEGDLLSSHQTNIHRPSSSSNYKQIVSSANNYSSPPNRPSTNNQTPLSSINNNIIDLGCSSSYTTTSDASQIIITPTVNEKKKIDSWTDYQTKWLLEKYNGLMDEVGPCKKFRTKRLLWDHLSMMFQSELNVKKSWEQVQNRYKTIMRQRKNAMDNNRTSGNTLVEVPYDEKIQLIAAKDDSIEPEILRGVDFFQKKPTNSPPKKRVRRCAQQSIIMKELRDIETRRIQREKAREEATERRHKEKIKALDRLTLRLSQNH